MQRPTLTSVHHDLTLLQEAQHSSDVDDLLRLAREVLARAIIIDRRERNTR